MKREEGEKKVERTEEESKNKEEGWIRKGK